MRYYVFLSCILNFPRSSKAPSISCPISLHTSLMACKFWSISGLLSDNLLPLPYLAPPSPPSKRAALPPPPRIVSLYHTSRVSFFRSTCYAVASEVMSANLVCSSKRCRSKLSSTPSSYSSRSAERISWARSKCSSRTGVVLKLASTRWSVLSRSYRVLTESK